MDQVFDSQFQAMKAAFAQDGIGIEIAYTPAGGPDYLYQTDRLLIDNRRVSIHEIQRVLPWTRPGSPREQPSVEFLTVLSTAPREGYAYLPVPEALDLLDRELGHKYGGGDGDEKIAESGDYSPVTPVHVLHITQTGASDVGRLCAPVEPEVPCCCPPGRKGREDGEGNEDRARDDCRPCPPPAGDNAGAGVLIGICDTGLLADIAHAPWLAGVTGQTDPLGPLLVGVPPIPDGLHAIPHYTGHGTFAAGMARCQAPGADVYVSHGILTSGAVLETVIVDKLVEMLEHQPAPQVVNLSAGAYTRHDLQLLSFTAFNGGGITLTAAAGNDATHRKFWPAAFSWAIGVGALGADHRDRAWFSNYGDWVNVYTVGEGLVNAYATGLYTYQEPPKRPAQQIFDGLARWCGTSFAAPLVAGLIAVQMASANVTAAEATATVLQQAVDQAIPGVGPVLYPR